VNFKVAIRDKYPRIPWELVADPLGTAEHTLWTSALPYFCVYLNIHSSTRNIVFVWSWVRGRV